MPLGSADSSVGVFAVAGEALAGVSAQVFELDFAVLVQGAHPSVEGCDFSSCLFHCGTASDRNPRPVSWRGRGSKEQQRRTPPRLGLLLQRSLFLLPCNDCAAVLVRAAESLEAPIEKACLDQAWFDPKSVSTLRTFEVVAPLHLRKPGPEVLSFGAVYQSLEGRNTGRSPNEELNPAGVARNIWLPLFRERDLAWVRADRTRENPFPV